MENTGYAVIDLETTGFGTTHRILEVGVVLLRPDLTVERTWETLVQPGRDIPNSHIHHITATDVVDAPSFADVAAYLGHLLNGRILVAHNAPFERGFLENEFVRAGIANGLPSRWVDTMVLGRENLGVAKLSDALAIAGLRNELAHSALGDATATAELLRYLHQRHKVSLSGYPVAAFPTAPEPRTQPRGAVTSESWVERLTRELPASGAKDEDAYRAELTRALIDHHVSRTEIRQLEHTALAAGLSADDVEAINEEFTRQLVIEAWADGVITGEERETLLTLAAALGVDTARVLPLLDEPQAATSPTRFTLSPGDRVAFTGSLDIPYEIWAQRAAAAGLDVGGVTRKCVLLVAANPDSMSGKAQKARSHGVPIVSEAAFAQFLGALERDGAGSSGEVAPEVPAQFPWLSADQVRSAGSSRSRIAAAWIALHPTQPLHMLADDLRPHHTPEATGTGIDRYLALWSLHHPEMLSASADDLLRLPGVGEKRRHKLVELVVDLAADGVAEVSEPAPVVEPVREPKPVEVAAPTEPWPSFDDDPAKDPTPEELLAEARSTSYNPYAVPVPANTTLLESTPLPVERTNRAAKVFKWSAIVAVASFFLFGMSLETFDPEAESFIAGLFAVVFLFGGLTAAVSGIWALVNRLRR